MRSIGSHRRWSRPRRRFGSLLAILFGSVIVLSAATAQTTAPATAPQDRTKLFDNEIKHFEELDATHILFVSIKPTPSRAKLLTKMKEANMLIHTFATTRSHLNYVDVASLMLDDKGEPRGELFGPDRLHMDHDGYVLWAKILSLVIGQIQQ